MNKCLEKNQVVKSGKEEKQRCRRRSRCGDLV